MLQISGAMITRGLSQNDVLGKRTSCRAGFACHIRVSDLVQPPDRKPSPYSQGQTPFFGKMPLSKISIFDIERYKKQRLEEDVQQNITKDGTPIYKGKTSPGTINRELAALSHLFTKAVEWGWLDHKPASIKRLKENGGRITYLTVDQIKRLLKAGQEDQNIQIYPLF